MVNFKINEDRRLQKKGLAVVSPFFYKIFFYFVILKINKMIVINPNNSIFTFTIIPKTYNVSGTYTMNLTDEQTNTLLGTFNASSITSINDLTNLTFTLLNLMYEGGFFNTEFLLNGVTVFKSRIFATTQNINSYTINSGNYVTTSITNNDYIII